MGEGGKYEMKMEMAEREDKVLTDMLDIIRFTEVVSAKLHRVTDEAKIFQVVVEEFAKSDHYTASILLLTDDGASLRLAETAIAPSRLEVLEKASGLKAKEYRIELSKSSIYRQVVKEGKTVHANVSDMIREFLPRPLAYLISKTMGYDKQSSILTPLYKQGKVVGILAMSCTELCEYFTHSVENLALHISTALELAHKNVQRQRAVQALKRYHDHLGELVEERTAELKTVNKKLLGEITERKQAEQALTKIEQEKSAILNSMSELMIYQDTEHRILWTNKVAAESVALSIEQLVGRRCYEIWHQRNKPCVGCPVAKARESGKPQEAEMTTPDGRVWFVRGYPIRDINKNLVGMVEVTLEITERKQAEQALADEVTRRRLLVDQSLDGIVVLDENAKVYEANQRFAEMLGYTPEEVRELHTWDWDKQFPPEKLLEMGRAVDEKGLHLETRHHRKDGSVIDVDISINGAVVAGQKLIFCVCRDITERKQAEEALRESEEKYKELAGSITDLFFAFGKDLRYTYWNKASEKLTGIPAKDALGKHLYDIFSDSEMTKRAGKIYREALRTQKVQSFVNEFRIRDKDYFFEISAYPSKDGLSVFAKDITERKVKEKDYQGIIHATTDGFWMLDSTGRFLDVNDAYCALTGYSREEMLNMSIPDIEAVEKPEETAQRIRRIMKNGHERFETRHRCKDGRIIDVEVSTTYSGAGNGRFFVFSRDITERKQAEEVLRESREKFKKMFESVTDAISVVDLNGVIIEANQRTVEMHGFASKDELLGRKALELVAPSDRERVTANMRKALKQGIIRGVEYTLLKADGSEFPGELSTSILSDASGKPVAHITLARDITERKQAEAALRESEERFRSIVENSQAGIMILDDAYRLVYVNDELCRMSGYPREEAIGQDFRQFLDEESKELVADRYRRRQKGEEVPPRYEFNFVRKDGQKRRVEISSAVIRDSAGKIKTVAQILDITERKRAEEALQAEKNKLQSLIDAMEDDLTIQDKDYNIIYQNEPVKARYGDHLGEKCYRVYEGGDKICDGCPVVEAFKDGKSHTSERKTVTPSGEVFFWENTANPIRDARGEIVACLEIGRNINERKQAEEALRESQKFSSSLLESAPNPISVVDLDISIRYVNPAFEKLTGFTLAEIVGRNPPYPWWPEEQRDRLQARLKDAVEHGGRKVGSEHDFQKKDGEHFWVSLNSAPVMQEGKPVYLVISWLDITERKLAEEKEKQLQQELYLAQRLASVGELAAGVAHEINNPLTGVLGFSQRLMRKSNDEAVRRDLEIIHDEARRAADVVQNLLTFARRRQPKKEYANINDILQRTLELRAYALQTSNIEVTTALAPRLPKVMFDFPQMQEVFLNIILNAEQAMSEAHGKGKLIIKSQRVKDHVRVSFADDGPGVSPENLGKVFDPFFTTREEKGGTGLGLSACHGIVTEHGGRIYVRSKPGKGATFFVELPLSPVETTVRHRV